MLMQSATLSPGIQRAHWAAIRTKTLISLAVSAALPTVFFWLINAPPPVALLGHNGLLPMMAGACIGGGFALTNIVTLILRGWIKKGKVPSLNRNALPPAFKLLAANLFLRAIECAIITLVVLVPICILLTLILPILPMDKIGLAIFNLISGAGVALVVSPIAALRALADQRPAT